MGSRWLPCCQAVKMRQWLHLVPEKTLERLDTAHFQKPSHWKTEAPAKQKNVSLKKKNNININEVLKNGSTLFW